MSRLSQWWNIPNGMQRKRMEALQANRVRSYERIAISRQEYNEACSNPHKKNEWVEAGKELMAQYPQLIELKIDVWGGASVLCVLKRTEDGVQVRDR
jgi:hypothetical protein